MNRLLFKEHPFNYEYNMDREIKLNFKGKDLININEALNHAWIIKAQKIINYIK